MYISLGTFVFIQSFCNIQSFTMKDIVIIITNTIIFTEMYSEKHLSRNYIHPRYIYYQKDSEFRARTSEPFSLSKLVRHFTAINFKYRRSVIRSACVDPRRKEEKSPDTRLPPASPEKKFSSGCVYSRTYTTPRTRVCTRKPNGIRNIRPGAAQFHFDSRTPKAPKLAKAHTPTHNIPGVHTRAGIAQ